MTMDATVATTRTNTDVLAQLRDLFASGRTRRPKWRTAQLRGIEQLVSQHEARIIEALDAVRRRPAFEAWMGDIMVTAHEASYARRHLRAWMRPKHTLASAGSAGHDVGSPRSAAGLPAISRLGVADSAQSALGQPECAPFSRARIARRRR
ncbi:MAG: aldehyde dehydrogenase [Mycobacterium sp.]|jgi:acyl-CoA reductase-like NAD-dependent aldehyde dehydrogenase|nr:aldehyde dehydrogenase [Mycobacterium sp.]